MQKSIITRKNRQSLMRMACGASLLLVSSLAHGQFWESLTSGRVESDNTIVWEQVSPGNAGFANLIRFHPTIPKMVMMCPDMWNAYQSDDNGGKWYGITDPDGEGEFYHIRDLYYSPSKPSFGLAVCSAQLWETHDTGKSWSIVPRCPWYKADTDGSDKESWKKKVASLAIDPNDADVWFVGGGSNVRGQEWLSCYVTVTSASPRGVSADNEGKMWRTTNAGKSWELVNVGLDAKAQVGRIIVNPKNSKQVFAASNYGIYRSENGGNTWSQISAGKLDNDIIMDMDGYYNEESGKFTLYVIDQVHYHPSGTTTTCSGGIYRSDDEGESWIKMNGDLGLDIGRLTGGVPANYYKFIATWFGQTEAKVKSLYPTLPTSALQFFNMISVDPSREGAVYVGFADPQIANSIMPGRLWTTSNNGEKWINTARLYEDTWAKDKAYWEERGNPWHENMVVGHGSPHMRFGTDYAQRSMRGLDVGVDGSVMIISDHSTMLSTDHGASWRQMDEDYTPSGAIVGHGNSNLPGLTIVQDQRNTSTLLGSGEHRVWIPTNDSPDDRIAIKYIESAQATVSNMVFDPYDVKRVYATSNRQEDKQYMFVSNDGGESWSKHGVATPATNKWLDDFYTNGLLIDPIDPNYLYLGITRIVDTSKKTQGGFFRSENNGKTFVQSNKGLPSPARINDIKFDPRDNTRASLYAAAEYVDFNQESPNAKGGLYHSTDRGKNWSKVNTPSTIKGVQFIEIDQTNRIYISTGYRGGGAGVWYSDDFGKNWSQIFKYAGAECVEVSPFDHNLIAVTTRLLSKNPGIYISRDRGATWSKSNKNITIPHQIEDVKFDIHNPAEMWLATLGCGYYKGTIENGSQVQVVETTPNSVEIENEPNIKLEAKIVNPQYEGEQIVWHTENPAIATVNANGVVTPVGVGQVVIWATAVDGRFSDFTQVTVHQKPAGIHDAVAEELQPTLYYDHTTELLCIEHADSYASAEIINQTGQKVDEVSQLDEIDTSSLSAGLYIVNLIGQEETPSLRFVKR